ncbi:hypothetical protein J5N97_026576 [Dioscorea zingiberensis]|uniref:Uncharacterized protein n=1 Tax=Dioscorea zingiberensis TaxID=325984 RepID=A0A9D5C356_9LILI|nr:hypothetical protein J5N97_026576 [Dioscorea zingiberensis]
MVRKRRTELPDTGEGSKSQEPSGGSGRGVSQKRTPTPQQGGGGRGWGPGSSQQPQQGGRSGGQPRGGMVPQQPGVPLPEYQVRGGARPRGGMPTHQCHGRRRGGGVGPGSSRGVGPSSSGPSRASAPELHQATQAPYQALPPLQSQASSSSQPPEMAPALAQQQLEQLSIQGETSSSLMKSEISIASRQGFPVDERGTMKSVVQYFQETYGFSIQHTTLPCLQVGNQQRPIYLPMEVCEIVKDQRYSKRLNEKQITALLKTVHHNAYNDDPYAREFGIKISKKLAFVEARILPAPWKMVNGGRVSNWTCINFSREVQDSVARCFCHKLAQMCHISGMDFAPEPILAPLGSQPKNVERTLNTRYNDVMNILKPQGKDLDLLIVILPDNNGSLYSDLKRICETDLGLVSQCCLTKHVFEGNKQYLANVALKINVKVGGRNTVLMDAHRCIPLVSDRPTIIFGADVTHPHPGKTPALHSCLPPAYYAHLAAFRARCYMEPETSDSGSMASGAAGRGAPIGVTRSTRVPGSAV